MGFLQAVFFMLIKFVHMTHKLTTQPQKLSSRAKKNLVLSREPRTQTSELHFQLFILYKPQFCHVDTQNQHLRHLSSEGRFCFTISAKSTWK